MGEEEDCNIEEIVSNVLTDITNIGISSGDLCKKDGKGNQIELSEVIGDGCKENVNGKEIVSIGLTTHDTSSDEKSDEKSDGKYDEMRDGKNFVKLVEAACDDKLDEVIVGGYGTHLGAIGGVEEFIKNSVKKNGSEVLEMECVEIVEGG
ncbi:hypothetical protein Tco_1190791 [Tanacetum coccineum]